MPKKHSEERDVHKNGQARLERVRALKRAKNGVTTLAQFPRSGNTVLVIARVRVLVPHIVDIESQAVRLRDIIVRHDAVRGNVARLYLVALSTPEDVQCAIVHTRIRPVRKKRILEGPSLHGHAEQVLPVKERRSADIVRVGKTEAFRRGFSNLQVLYRHALIVQGFGLVRTDAVLACALQVALAILLFHPVLLTALHTLAMMPHAVDADEKRITATSITVIIAPGDEIRLRVPLKIPGAVATAHVVADDIRDVTSRKILARQLVTVALRLESSYRSTVGAHHQE